MLLSVLIVNNLLIGHKRLAILSAVFSSILSGLGTSPNFIPISLFSYSEKIRAFFTILPPPPSPFPSPPRTGLLYVVYPNTTVGDTYSIDALLWPPFTNFNGCVNTQPRQNNTDMIWWSRPSQVALRTTSAQTRHMYSQNVYPAGAIKYLSPTAVIYRHQSIQLKCPTLAHVPITPTISHSRILGYIQINYQSANSIW